MKTKHPAVQMINIALITIGHILRTQLTPEQKDKIAQARTLLGEVYDSLKA
jgi:hypothetical protein